MDTVQIYLKEEAKILDQTEQAGMTSSLILTQNVTSIHILLTRGNTGKQSLFANNPL